MPAYYNDNEPYAAEWLRNLISAGHLPAGDVDERSITDVQPDDLRGYTQCHFFAGIGGWAYALRLAGVADLPCWTGSCPCQPFSVAGKRLGCDDPRHLWPEWRRLISACRPPVVFGEQVANGAGVWIDLVRSDLEEARYAFGAAILPAASVGAPHIRDRWWFVAHAECVQLRQQSGRSRGENRTHPTLAREHGAQRIASDADGQSQHTGAFDAEVATLPQSAADTDCEPARWASVRRGERGFWEVEPEMGRVAHGIPGRVGRLRAYGNAIVPQAAAEFIAAFVAI